MNLHGIVSGAISAVNPPVTATLQKFVGYTTNAAGQRTPSYTNTGGVAIQVQALTGDELKQIDGLNIQGVLRGVYLNGNWQGVIRTDQLGGDLMQFPEMPGGPTRTWRVFHVLETWQDWSKVAVVLQ